MAKGTRRMSTRHRTAELSGREGSGNRLTSVQINYAMSAYGENAPQDFHRESGQHERGARSSGRQEYDCSKYNRPSGYQQKKSSKFHSFADGVEAATPILKTGERPNSSAHPEDSFDNRVG